MFSPLAKEFSSLLRHLPEDKATALASWFMHHPDYDKNMWTEEEAGVLFYTSLFEKSDYQAGALLDIVLEETKKSPIDLFSPAEPGATHLLQAFWKKFSQYKYLSSSSLDHKWEKLLLLLEKTPAQFWTFADKEGVPGSGLINEIWTMAHDNKTALSVIKKICKVYPQPLSAKKWLGIKKFSHVEQLLEMGYSLEDEIILRAGQGVPFWKILAGSEIFNSNNIRYEKHKILKKIDEDQLKKFQALQDKMKIFAPEHRRATVGYIKNVLERKDRDGLGWNSLDYLFRHRTDLLHLLYEKMHTFSPEDKDHFSKPDIAGFGLGFRAFVLLNPSDFQKFKKACEDINMDCSLSIGKKGWFEEASPWQSIVKGGARQTSSRTLRGNLLMEEIFGDKEHQEKWVKWWDKNLHILKGSENPLTVNKKAFSMMARQAAVINFHEDLSSSGIIPALADRLHFFHACVYRFPSNTASEAWKIGGSPEGFYRLGANEVIPVFSQEMHDIVMSDLFSPSSKYNQEANKRFRSHAQKQLLTNQISSAQESAPAKKIKM